VVLHPQSALLTAMRVGKDNTFDFVPSPEKKVWSGKLKKSVDNSILNDSTGLTSRLRKTSGHKKNSKSKDETDPNARLINTFFQTIPNPGRCVDISLFQV